MGRSILLGTCKPGDIFFKITDANARKSSQAAQTSNINSNSNSRICIAPRPPTISLESYRIFSTKCGTKTSLNAA